MASVEDYFERLTASLGKIAREVRRVVKEAAPEAQETTKWSMPCYVRNGNVCAIDTARDYVRLQFFRGAELQDPQGLLEGTGKGMRHVKVHSIEALPRDAIRELVQGAVRLQTKS